MKKKLFISLLSFSLLPQQVFSKELKGNKTNIHVSNYGGIKTSKAELGKTAPDFIAKDSSNKDVRLSKFIDKNSVLLVFYPGDNTPGCTKQLSLIRDDYKNLEKLGIKIFGINSGDEKSHKKFIADYKFPFELLVDGDSSITKLYNSVGTFGFTNRTVVLINKKGDIVLFERGMPDVSAKKIANLIK